MCGIFFSAQNINPAESLHEILQLRQKLRNANAARGPDAQRSYTATLPKKSVSSMDDSRILMEFFVSELRLRGELPVIVQPHEKDGNFLCWNGEIFGGMEISSEENDGVQIFGALRTTRSPEEVRDVFASVEGPYAFVFYSHETQKLHFARDPLGRRSLLIHLPSAPQPWLLLVSVSAGDDPAYSFEEVSTNHIHVLDMQQLGVAGDVLSFKNCLTSLPRQSNSKKYPYAEPAKVNPILPPADHPVPRMPSLDTIPEWLATPVNQLILQLDRSVYLRVRDIPRIRPSKDARVAALFSGGIDSTILTLLAHRHIPLDEPIDLLNVAFENPWKIKLKPEGNIGGLSKREKKKRTLQNDTESQEASYMVPDRVTGLQELVELRRLCPGRRWNFVSKINVPYEVSLFSLRIYASLIRTPQESQAARPIIEALMFPSKTVMDLSLAQALYFASRGVGCIREHPGADPAGYSSTARVLLNGLGSDELLGGYGRHRTTFTHAGGWESVIKELQLEIERIPTRNLGRDDRVISSHGKETRHPFLDLNVVSFLTGLPVYMKLDPRLELGVGDKMLLRLAAHKLGLVEASSRKKKAMQFGSQSARMDGEKRGDLLIA
ncbi:hypothetical protein E1B28_001286 [Marasmius oreades]|uniref:Asparagine synthetase domain-containing protein n=1 Tax=Marasmius oreades TaxID=181124 RepID=A0A9P8AFH5_9AGAR|nr:uncharacterized protein E1B28_001286 [Marasmius oreades]KAG7099435.1 hypothetical protein E1B28_001286 [Marasmius oreades]